MIKKADVVIIGGGVVGCSTAYNLAKMGCKNVVVFEKNTLASGSTGRCSGGLRQQFGLEMNCVLARESIKIFENLSQELDYDIELHQDGYLMLAYSEPEVMQFKKNVALQQSLNINSRFLTVEEIKEIVPNLNTEDVLAGTICPTDGYANPFKTNFAYAEAAQKLGVNIYKFTEVKEIDLTNHKIVSVNTDRGKVLTHIVVNAAGGYAGIIGKMVGVDLPIYPLRHQNTVTEPIDPVCKPAIMTFSRNHWMQQKANGTIILSYGEPDDRRDFGIGATWQYACESAKKSLALLPILKEVSMVRQWAGLYEMSPDAQPILGKHPEVDAFYLSIGFSGHGFMLSPIVGKVNAELILTGKTSIPIDKLDIRRFERGELIIEPNVV